MMNMGEPLRVECYHIVYKLDPGTHGGRHGERKRVPLDLEASG